MHVCEKKLTALAAGLFVTAFQYLFVSKKHVQADEDCFVRRTCYMRQFPQMH